MFKHVITQTAIAALILGVTGGAAYALLDGPIRGAQMDTPRMNVTAVCIAEVDRIAEVPASMRYNNADRWPLARLRENGNYMLTMSMSGKTGTGRDVVGTAVCTVQNTGTKWDVVGIR